MRPSFALLSLILIISWSALAPACSVVNTDHCGNQDGNATCLQRDAATPYCSICVADNNGCLAADPGAACLAETAAPTSVDPATSNVSSTGASTGPEPTTGTTAPGTASSSDTTLTGETTSSTATTANTTTSTGDDSTSSTGDTTDDSDSTASSTTGGPVCGNNKIEGEEVCDGTDLGKKTCATLLPDKWGGGKLTCNDCSSYNDTMCCIGVGQECNLVMPDGECCGGLSCKSAEPLVTRCQN